MSGAASDVGAATAALFLWRILFAGGEGYLRVASGERNVSSKLGDFQEHYFQWPEEADQAAEWCAQQSEAGAETYFCAHLLTVAQRRGKNAAPVRALWADGDGATLPEDFPEPSVTVESSPGRTQWYWPLAYPVEPKVAERLNKRIALATGADPSGYDLTQLLRPPGTVNRKYPDAPLVRVAETTGEVHEAAGLDEALPALPTAPEREPYDGPPDAGFALEEWLERFPEAEAAIIGKREDEAARVKYAVVCPWADEHTGGDTSGTFVGQFRSGALFFRCHHGHCDGRGWSAYRAFHEPYEGDYPTVTFIDDMRDSYDTEAQDGNAGGDAGDTVTPRGGADPTPTADVPPFPVDALPPVLRRLVLEAAHAKECPPDFVAVPLLPALGVAVGASRCVDLARTYQEHPIVWTAVVAPPASGKSPAEDVAMGPVEEQRKVFAQEYRKALEAWKEEHANWEQDAADARKRKKRVPPEPEKPVKERIRVGDTTLEALLLRLTENPRGLVLGRDELAGFFGAMGQYKGGKGSDREAWLSLHSGKTPPLDRKSADEAHDIFHPHVCVVGSIQPGRMDVLDTGAGDGMVERFLISWPEARLLPDAEEDVSEEAEEAYRRVWRFLYALEPGIDDYGNPVPRGVSLAPEAREIWKRHRRTLKEEAYRPGTPEYVQGVLGKLRAYLARLALILALVRVAESCGAARETVEAEDVERAWELVSYFLAHARRVHSELKDEGRPESRQSMLAGALGELLEKMGGEWKGKATELFDALKEMGHGRALPKVPDSLTEEVLKAARRTPALHAEKGRTGRGRYVRILWAVPVGGGTVARDGGTASPASPDGNSEDDHDAA